MSAATSRLLATCYERNLTMAESCSHYLLWVSEAADSKRPLLTDAHSVKESRRPFLFLTPPAPTPHPGCFPVYFEIRLRSEYSLGALGDSVLTIFVFLPAKQHSNGPGRKLIILVFLCGSKWWLRDCEFLIKFSAQQRSMKRCRPCLRD